MVVDDKRTNERTLAKYLYRNMRSNEEEERKNECIDVIHRKEKKTKNHKVEF
jgi:hypothetical protein